MDPALTIVATLVGAACALWIATVAVGSYVVWAWVYKPWRALRADVVALNQKVEGLAASIQQQRVLTLTDEEVAHREARVRARQAARAGA